MPKKRSRKTHPSSSTRSGQTTRPLSHPRSASQPIRSGVKKKPSVSSTQSESELEQQFLKFLQQNGLFPTQQHVFHPTRQWRFDFCWPPKKIAIEIQGFGPGHNSYTGMSSDYEKHNAALLLGWKIIYFMAHDLNPYKQGNTLSTIKNMLGAINAPT